jgi:hypothetical protein
MKNLARLVALAAALPAAALAKDYYVDSRLGSDANDGSSPAKAFATLQKASSRLRAGDTLNFAPGGRYNESLAINASGTAASPIAVKGNGSTLSGLVELARDKWESKGDGLYFFKSDVKKGALNPRVYLKDGKCISVSKKPQELLPLEAAWKADGVWFRAEPSRHPGDYRLSGTLPGGSILHSGVFIVGRSYITIEGLTCEYFANDGFNVHLSCHGIVFRNITGRHCGDDGFSVHEDVQSSVFNGHFFDNNYGIQDVNASQTEFFGCIIESNRVCGVDMYGGMRNLRDCKVRHNRGAQIRISTNKAAHMNMADNNPMLNTLAYLGGVSVGPGEGAGISVGRNTRVCAMNCDFAGVDVGVAVANGGVMHLVSSRIGECRKAALKDGSNGGFLANKSKIWPEQNGEKK